jgi:hypothetical protein
MNKNNKLKINDIKPFTSEPIIIKKNGNNIIKLLLSNDSNNKPVPLIPGMEFYDNDNIGSKIINNYYKIKTYIDNLSITKNFIDTILEANKSEFEKIIIKKANYNLDSKTNLIFEFNDNINTTFTKNNTFEIFFNKYNNPENNYNFIKKYNSSIPLFIVIFQENYNKQSTNSNTDNYFSKKKNYFISLFRQYTKIRENILINYLTQTIYMKIEQGGKIENIEKKFYNTGILSFGNVFNLLKKNKKNINIKKKNNGINFSKIIIRNNIITNSNNSFQIGDKVVINNNQTGVIIKIDFKNNPNAPYKVLLNSNNQKINVKLNELTRPTLKNNKKLKNTLSNKIDLYTRLYNPSLSKDYYITNCINNINDIYNNLYNSINNLFDNKFEPNLLNVIKYYIDIDYNIIKLIFNYVDIITFKKSMASHYDICNDIYKRINIFAGIYPSFVDWYNKLIGATTNINNNKYNMNGDISDFETFYNKMLSELQV